MARDPGNERAHVEDVVHVGHQLVVEVAGDVLVDGRHEDHVRLWQLQPDVEENALGEVRVRLVQEVAEARGHGAKEALNNQVVDEVLDEVEINVKTLFLNCNPIWA